MWLIYLIMAVAFIRWALLSLVLLVIEVVVAAKQQRPSPLTLEQKRLGWWKRTFG